MGTTTNKRYPLTQRIRFHSEYLTRFGIWRNSEKSEGDVTNRIRVVNGGERTTNVTRSRQCPTVAAAAMSVSFPLLQDHHYRGLSKFLVPVSSSPSSVGVEESSK